MQGSIRGPCTNEERWRTTTVEANGFYLPLREGGIGRYDIVFCSLRGAGEGTTQDPDPCEWLCGIGGLDRIEFFHWSFTIAEDLRLLLMDP